MWFYVIAGFIVAGLIAVLVALIMHYPPGDDGPE